MNSNVPLIEQMFSTRIRDIFADMFTVNEDIDILPDAKILKSHTDYACNHHEYENVKKDRITIIQWLEPMHK